MNFTLDIVSRTTRHGNKGQFLPSVKTSTDIDFHIKIFFRGDIITMMEMESLLILSDFNIVEPELIIFFRKRSICPIGIPPRCFTDVEKRVRFFPAIIQFIETCSPPLACRKRNDATSPRSTAAPKSSSQSVTPNIVLFCCYNDCISVKWSFILFACRTLVTALPRYRLKNISLEFGCSTRLRSYLKK